MADYGNNVVLHERTRCHVTDVTAQQLLQRLDGIRKEGSGWRARCPSCNGHNRDVLSIALGDRRVLVHCFAGCTQDEVLEAVGLTWKDLQPPRNWPATPEEKRKWRQAQREVSTAVALEMLAREVVVLRAASARLVRWQALSEEDDKRLAEAARRIEEAAAIFVEPKRWRPAA